MPTPFEPPPNPEPATANAEWAPRTDKPRRSVFANYHDAELSSAPAVEPPDVRPIPPILPIPLDGVLPPTPTALQLPINTALARAFLYQFLARAFEDPSTQTWTWLTDPNNHATLQSAAQHVVRLLRNRTEPAVPNESCSLTELSHHSSLTTAAETLTAQLLPDDLESFQTAYVTAFGHAARGDCPLNEVEYGDLKADPLFQPHRLADLTAFYRAFGLEVADGAAERPDHIGMELEFMSVLAAKEAYAHQHQWDDEPLGLCLDAQKKFLREHLGRWSPAFARRLARATTHETLAALAGFLRVFIAAECARFDLTAGSEDLLLRPVDQAAETLCASCGLQNLPPGAVPYDRA